MIIRKVRAFVSKIRRALRLLWGRSWPLRSRFIPRSEAEDALAYLQQNQDRLVFVLGSGRSGTQLISDLLEQSADAAIFHEPNFREDVGAMDVMRHDAALTERYWREFRCVEVYRRWTATPGKSIYGEVNGTIRYQAAAIRKLFPEAKLLLMVRDGRGVVRSVMGWPQFYGPRSKGAYALAPLSGDPFFEEWSRMSRFEKVCWSWRDTNEFLMDHIPASHWLQLERITSDFDYFTKQFANGVGIEISYEVWRARVMRRSRNASSSYGFPAWEDWTREQKDSFVRICGDTMAKLGYVVS